MTTASGSPSRAGALRAAAAGLAVLVLAVGGYGLWWVERNRPVWLRPGLWGVSRACETAADLPRLVLAFHYPWYGTPSGPTGHWRHWNHSRVALADDRIPGLHDPRREIEPGRLDIGAAHYPAGGPYDSGDAAVIRRQLDLARWAGLDGFVVSWWGRESEEARVFGDLLREARDAGLRLAPYDEAGELWRRGPSGVAADLEALLDEHGAATAFLRVAGAPVIFVYGAHRVRPGGWELVLRRQRAGSRRAYVITSESPRPGWLDRFDALHVYSPASFLGRGRDLEAVYRRWARLARQAGIPFMPAVAPGFDDRTIRQPGTRIERRDGATYDATWRAALAVEPAWVLVASWNEWHGGTEIEPSREHGARYLEATRRWADTFRSGPR